MVFFAVDVVMVKDCKWLYSSVDEVKLTFVERMKV